MKFSSPMNAGVNYILNLDLTCGILLCCHHHTTHHNGQSRHQRCIPHNPHHHHRIGLTLLGQVAEGTRFHKQLPVGLASATAIFSTLAKALEWVLQHRSLSKLRMIKQQDGWRAQPTSSTCTPPCRFLPACLHSWPKTLRHISSPPLTLGFLP